MTGRGRRMALALAMAALGANLGLTAATTVANSARDRADACRVLPEKTGAPTRITLGQTVSVTLRMRGDCDVTRRARSDIMLVIDQSGSMAGPNLEAAKAAATVFLDGIDYAVDQVGVVGFDSEAHLLEGLSTDRARLGLAIDRLVPSGGTNIAAGVDEARHVYKNPGHRRDANRVIVVMTDGQNNAGPAVAISAARYAKADGARVFAIGFGGDADMGTIVRMASNTADAFAAPTRADLTRIYAAIAARVSATVAFTSLVVTDTLASEWRYVDATGSPRPDRSGLTMVWDLSFVPPAGAVVRYAVEPRAVGRLRVSDAAVGHGVGPDGAAAEFAFPPLYIDVLPPPAPTATPGPACICGTVRRRVPPAVIAHAAANPERYFGWQMALDPGKPPGPANPPRTCLSLQNPAIDYHPQFNTPIWRVGCP